MCGIFVYFSHNRLSVSQIDWCKLDRRGPNAHGVCIGCLCADIDRDLDFLHSYPDQTTDMLANIIQKYEQLHESCRELSVTFFASVLHMRSFTVQPIIHESGNVLLWNGELFHTDQYMDGESNDGEYIMNTLSVCSSDEEILKVFSRLNGPWSFVFWQKNKKRLWFGRDSLGRRSLLSSISDDHFVLSSVTVKPLDNWSEIPATGIFSLTFTQEPTNPFVGNLKDLCSVTIYPWIKLPYGLETSLYKSGCVSLAGADSSLDLAALNPLISEELQEVFGGKSITVSEYGIICPFTTITDLVETSIKVECRTVEMSSSETKQFCARPHEDNVEQRPDDTNTELRPDENNSELLRILNHNGEVCTPGSIYTSQEISCDLKESGVSTLNINDSEKYNDELLNSSAKSESVQASCSVKSQPKSELCLTSVLDHEIYKHVTPQQISAADELNQCLSEAVCARVVHHPLICSHCFTQRLLTYKNSSIQARQGEAAVGSSCDSKSSTTSIPCRSSAKQQTSSDSLSTEQSVECYHASVAVLFSGGIDSLTLACLADRFVPRNQPIDLLNVAFEQRLKSNKRKSSLESEITSSFEVPDRITGRQGLEELRSVCPDRLWNFVEINVTQNILQEARAEHITDLLSPLKTVLDDSIGCALWFAARGSGHISMGHSQTVEYCSPARVVLIGSGADEQLAGYSRHRVKFQSGGWSALVDEVKMEMNRISCRNLGRDDRIVSDHGREARFPFLDEKVVSYLSSLPMSLKADLTLRRGIGEKLLLRLAAVRLGLHRGALLPKRAIQFGSRIAKLENRNEKADDICQRNVLDELC